VVVGAVRSLVVDLVETWSEREDRARRLAVLHVVVEIIETAERDVLRAEAAAYSAIDRLETAREHVNAAYGYLPTAEEPHGVH
jgi:hypothetical protein